jgi:hypothetical protein
MSENHTVRVFVSSPSDVRPERLIAERVVKRLAREFSYHFRLEAVLWEREPLLATQGKPVAPRQLRLTHRNRKFADSPLEGAGFEPSVPRERVCAFRDHVHSLQSVRRPLRSKWYIDDSDGPLPFGLDIHGQYLLVDAERASVSRTASGSG